MITIRKYEPIWEAIKKNHKASLTAEPHLHHRIIKAVRKEKCKDVGWRFLLLDKGIKYKLVERIIGETIAFSLEDCSPITVDSL